MGNINFNFSIINYFIIYVGKTYYPQLKLTRMKSISEMLKNEIAEHTEIKEVRKGWDEAFKKAILNGEIPENDMFEGMKNDFDDLEW